MNRVSNIGFFPRFPVIFRGLKNSQNLDFSAVSWDLEGRAHPKKKFTVFLRDGQVSKFGFFVVSRNF